MKNLSYYMALFFLLSAMSLHTTQPKTILVTVTGEVIATDALSGHVHKVNYNLLGPDCYFDIFNVQIRTAQNEVMVIGIIYNIFTDGDSLKHKFNLEIGKNYIFQISKFTPCFSDFPAFCNCDYRIKRTGVVSPTSGRIEKLSYSEIYRIIHFIPMDN